MIREHVVVVPVGEIQFVSWQGRVQGYRVEVAANGAAKITFFVVERQKKEESRNA